MRIGIAGVGGIGSNTAMHLVRSGITKFTLVDFDRVEPSNLNRQFYFEDQVGEHKVHALEYNLFRISSVLDIETHNIKIDASNIGKLFNQCDVLVEGFDQKQDKKLFLEHLGPTGKLIVSANGIAGIDTTSIIQKKISNIHIIGDFTTDCEDAPLYSHKVMVVAAAMAEVILKKYNTLNNE